MSKIISILEAKSLIEYKKAYSLMTSLHYCLFKYQNPLYYLNNSDYSTFLNFNNYNQINYNKIYDNNKKNNDNFIGYILILEHPTIYSIGCNTPSDQIQKLQSIISPEIIHFSDRGGMITCHAPGQKVVYFIINLIEFFSPFSADIKKFIIIIQSFFSLFLKNYCNIDTKQINNYPGLWIHNYNNFNYSEHFDNYKLNSNKNNNEKNQNDFISQNYKKILFLGLKVKNSITYHGISLNIHQQSHHFAKISHACGIKDCIITSIEEEIKYKSIYINNLNINQIFTHYIGNFIHYYDDYIKYSNKIF
ncbi:lipoyl protein ligase domain-containing protein [Lyticum sinuosum]|uniref:Octanoyltransferase n=1 Tax=Lyticum sinuosum TaxID=1332059 RepID=A0AAE4VK32_9RICK|nr:hypothetical protein [Lyticum sinuosum]MDZ5761425.1 Octanoyltransferase [Lyticum sinuosum]